MPSDRVSVQWVRLRLMQDTHSVVGEGRGTDEAAFGDSGQDQRG
jgi:hypothetical protein